MALVDADARREQLRVIRATYNAQAAADAAGIPKRVRVKNPSNPSGYGYRTLTPKQRKDRVQRLISGQTKTIGGVKQRQFGKITPATARRIGATLEGRQFSKANAELAIITINRERAEARRRLLASGEPEATLRPLLRRNQPLSEKSKEALRQQAEMGDWKQFRASYESQVTIARRVIG